MLFEQLDSETWSIRSLDQALNLRVRTGWRRYENLNLRLVGSQFSQWQSRVSGQIQLPDQQRQVVFNDEYALLEQHYAKW